MSDHDCCLVRTPCILVLFSLTLFSLTLSHGLPVEDVLDGVGCDGQSIFTKSIDDLIDLAFTMPAIKIVHACLENSSSGIDVDLWRWRRGKSN